jgi:hypothetical protein
MFFIFQGNAERYFTLVLEIYQIKKNMSCKMTSGDLRSYIFFVKNKKSDCRKHEF